MITILSYLKTSIAFITIILSLSLIHDNYTASAQESYYNCEKAVSILAKLNDREEFHAEMIKRWVSTRKHKEKELTKLELEVLDCNINRPQTDKGKEECSKKDQALKSKAKVLPIIKENIKRLEKDLVKNRSDQEKLRSVIKSNNCNGDSGGVEEQTATVEYGDRKTYKIVGNGEDNGCLHRINWIAHDKHRGEVVLFFSEECPRGVFTPLTLSANKEFGRYVAKDKDGLAKWWQGYLKNYPHDKKNFKPSTWLNNILFIKPVGKNLEIEWRVRDRWTLHGIAYPME